jgi:hypothetical protein
MKVSLTSSVMVCSNCGCVRDSVNNEALCPKRTAYIKHIWIQANYLPQDVQYVRQIETRAHLNDDDLFEAASAASRELAEAYGGDVWTPQRDHFITFAKVEGQIAALAVWQIWEGEAFIGTAWTAPQFRRQGLYKEIVAAIRTEAAKRTLKCVSACVDGKNYTSLAVHDRVLGARSIVKFEMPV